MNDIDELVRRLAPRYELPAAAATPDEELLHRIVGHQPARRASWFSRRRLAFAVPAVAGLAAAVLAVVAFLPASGPVGPAPAQALSVAQRDGYLDIRIVDPVADPQRYRDELAKYGLNIELTLAPAAPDQVGRVIFSEYGDTGNGPSIVVIEAPGNCTANGDCSVGIRVPLDFRSYARIVIGRTPKPGEEIEGDAPVLTPQVQQQLHGLVGKRVSDARAQLTAMGWTADYRVGADDHRAEAGEVPGTWYVYQVAPLSGRVAVLWVSENGKEPDR